MPTRLTIRTVPLLLLSGMLAAQGRPHDPVTLKYWPAPLYWQPSAAGPTAAAASGGGGAPVLSFVAIPPCRLVDTRTSQGFPAGFGPPSLAAGETRTFPVEASTTCAVPVSAKAYSLNVTVVPPGPFGYLTLFPAVVGPQPAPPTVATLTDLEGAIVSNAAVIGAGTDGEGGLDVYASDATDLVIDMNGYYAAPADTLSNMAIGNEALANDTTGNQNTAAGANALEFNTTGANNTAMGASALFGNTTGSGNTALGSGALVSNTTGNNNTGIGDEALQYNMTGTDNTTRVSSRWR